MTDLQSPWLRARGQVMFLIGLVVASVLILRIERAQFVPVSDVRPLSPLLQPDAEEAGRQWAFVERNTRASSGLTALEEGGAVTSVAGIGYAIKAVLSAHRLGFIDGEAVHVRVTALLAVGERLSLDETGQLLDVDTGAVKVERAMEPHTPYESALELVAWGYPSLRARALAELERWTPAPARVPAMGAAGSALQRASRVLQVAAIRGQGGRR